MTATLAEWGERPHAVIDSAPFHLFGDDDRRQGPRRFAEGELRAAFAEGWKVETVRPTRFEVRGDVHGFEFSAGGPKAWLVVVRRE